MGRSPCCKKEGLNKGAWTAVEDKILSDYITAHGEGRWRSIPRESGLKRCGKSCRLRWLNYLRPDIKRGNITPEEDDLIIRLHNLLGNRWSLIAGRLPGRTDNEIKNYWNTTLGKKAKGDKEEETKRRADGAEKPPPRTNVAVRTKATRCTRKLVLVDSELEPAAYPSGALGSESQGKGSPSTTSETMDLGKLAMNSSINKLLLTDMTDSDFWKFCQFEGGLTEEWNGNANANRDENSYNLDFPEETMTNWGDQNDFLQYLI
ncbi:hypothetical protein MLD38_005898 [Melastoma candidum]|uniref:Uncharacterized protein n=1 Tax=Melastoma candidum TaxID=119954 RepID=A0ACB9RMD7_9MYRT|nr:hypothetical protein MLD38_005898 [Melastoma candidum]